MFLPIVFIICALFQCNANVLVLLENLWVKESHSEFLNLITSRGYNTTLKTADDPSLDLMNFGEYIYSHLVILAPSVEEFGGTLSVKEILNFIDNGGNVVVVANSNVGNAIRELGSGCGIEFDDEKTAVIDHQNYDIQDDGSHTLLTISEKNILSNKVITSGATGKPLLYRGIGISTDPNNPLLINIVHADRTSYSYNTMKPISDYPNTVGVNTQLISALQARNNARVLFIGSLEFLSNTFFASSVSKALLPHSSPVSGNKDLTDSLLRWTFGERGQLRVVSVNHYRIADKATPQQYTIMDEVLYAIKVEIKNDAGDWVPFHATDLQLEFVRIDPFIRTTLQEKDGVYSTVLKLPDVYGVFRFVVDYNRLGYTHLLSITQVPVRPFTHTQYERFIEGAYPYYTSALSMIVGVVVFSFLFLYYKDDKEKGE